METEVVIKTEVERWLLIGLDVFILFLVLLLVLLFFFQGSEEAQQRLLLPAPRLRPLGLLERGRD